jgi:hypothetical protein
MKVDLTEICTKDVKWTELAPKEWDPMSGFCGKGNGPSK